MQPSMPPLWAKDLIYGLIGQAIVKAVVFPVVMYGCESWTFRRLSAKELMLWNCGAREDS